MPFWLQVTLTFFKPEPLDHNGKMTNFRGILGQSWNSEIHKVKLLKLQNFNFDLKFLWNLSVFHYEPKILDLKKVFSNLETEGQGRGTIMGLTRLLLLGPFYTIQTQRHQTFLVGVYICQEILKMSAIIYTVTSKYCGKLPKIFVAYSENLNIKQTLLQRAHANFEWMCSGCVANKMHFN